MERQEILELLTQIGVIQHGHFLLTSGRHSDTCMQSAHLFQHPEYSEKLSGALAEQLKGEAIDLVVGPAMGGVILAYEVARQLGLENIYSERVNGRRVFRRGFHIRKGQRVAIVEDVITTGASVNEVMELVEEAGGVVAAIGVILNRAEGKVDFGVPLYSLIGIDVPSYPANECPQCQQGIALVKPGQANL